MADGVDEAGGCGVPLDRDVQPGPSLRSWDSVGLEDIGREKRRRDDDDVPLLELFFLRRETTRQESSEDSKRAKHRASQGAKALSGSVDVIGTAVERHRN